MKRFAQLLCGCLTATMIAGCRAPNPYTLPVDPPPPPDRYGKTVVSQGKAEKVAVHVTKTKHNFGEDVANELDASLSEMIGSLAFFELVPRGNFDPLVIEAILSGRNENSMLSLADYAIGAHAVNINVEEQRGMVITPSMATSYANKFRVALPMSQNVRCLTVTLSINFQFYQLSPVRMIKTKTISRTGEGLWDNVVHEWLMENVRECTREFAQFLGGKFAPEARVIETRGDHEVAWISLGANYGLSEGTEVVFFTYLDKSPFLVSDKPLRREVAVGRVLKAEEDSAWVEVFDYADTRVEQGMYVSVRHRQDPGFLWRYFFRKIGAFFDY